MKKLLLIFFILTTSPLSYAMKAADAADDKSGCIMKAVWQDNAQALQDVITEEAHPIITPTPYGTDPLGWAAYHGNLLVTTLLLKVGYQPDINPEGNSAVHIAAYHNHVFVLNQLLTYPYFVHVDKEKAQNRAKTLLAVINQVAPRVYNQLDKHVTCNILPNGDVARCIRNVPIAQEQQELTALTEQHMAWLNQILEYKICVEGNIIKTTPYEIAQEKGHRDVMQLLEPQAMQKRLLPMIITRYRHELHCGAGKRAD